MTNSFQSCAVVSLRDVELEGQVNCARRRLVVIAPGLSESVAKAIIKKWYELGREAVQVVLDTDPEVCRLGLGDLSALQMLYQTAERIGGRIHQQQGLRVGVMVTDETTTIYSPTPRLIEAGGQPGERLNALRFDTPMLDPAAPTESDLRSIDLHPERIVRTDVQRTTNELSSNPPLKFDVARKVRVFNTQFEFVEFEMHGLFLSRRRVSIPSDLMGLAKDPKAQRLLRSSFQLVDENSDVSGERATRLKQFIAKTYLTNLPGYGTVILRSNKESFHVAVKSLERYVHRFQRRLKKKLQNAIDSNREVLTSALLPSVAKNPPARWKRFIGEHPTRGAVEDMLRSELTDAFGNSDGVFQNMNIKVVFKGITYELLCDPEFMRIATKELRLQGALHDEFDAAKADQQKV